jgi:hypothetical protein
MQVISGQGHTAKLKMYRIRGFGLLLCIVGACITAAGVIGYIGDGEAAGITDRLDGIIGFVIGLGIGGIGILIYLLDFLLQIFRNRENFRINYLVRIFHWRLYQEVEYPSDDELLYEDTPITQYEH